MKRQQQRQHLGVRGRLLLPGVVLLLAAAGGCLLMTYSQHWVLLTWHHYCWMTTLLRRLPGRV
jgi:hypothetical protein